MTYAVQQDLVDRFGEQELIELTDRTNTPPSAVDATVVAKALGDADQLVDGYLAAAEIALPLSSVPDLVKAWACDIARYRLHAAAPTETVRKNYEDCLRQLRDVASGTIRLQVAGVEPAATGDTVQTEAPDRVFSRETLEDF